MCRGRWNVFTSPSGEGQGEGWKIMQRKINKTDLKLVECHADVFTYSTHKKYTKERKMYEVSFAYPEKSDLFPFLPGKNEYFPHISVGYFDKNTFRFIVSFGSRKHSLTLSPTVNTLRFQWQGEDYELLEGKVATCSSGEEVSLFPFLTVAEGRKVTAIMACDAYIAYVSSD
jgi:hypothetical protein